jgi:hypothetical protein
VDSNFLAGNLKQDGRAFTGNLLCGALALNIDCGLQPEVLHDATGEKRFALAVKACFDSFVSCQ